MQSEKQTKYYDPQAIEPNHYEGDLILRLTADFDLTFTLGSAVKYICRAGRKEGNPFEQDIAKAIFYLEWSKRHELGREYMWISEEVQMKEIVRHLKLLMAAYELDGFRWIAIANILLTIDSDMDRYGDYLSVSINLLKELIQVES